MTAHILPIILIRVIYLPPRRGEDLTQRQLRCAAHVPAHMLEAIVPRSLNNFPGVGLVLLQRCVRYQPHVVVDVKVEQWSRFATGLVDDKVVECVVLLISDGLSCARTCGMIRSSCGMLVQTPTEKQKAHLDVHQVVDARTPQLWQLTTTLAKESSDIITLLALLASGRLLVPRAAFAHLDGFAMPTPIPVRISDLNNLLFQLFLLG